MSKPAWTCPMFLPGKEPLPAGFTEDDRATLTQTQEWTHIMQAAMESCAFKCGMSGIAGFGLGGFFALLSASLTVDDPMRRSNLQAAAMASHGPGYSAPPEPTTMQQTKIYFKETGKNMYRSAKGFGKVGALYSGIECCIEGYRAKNDLVNPMLAGFLSGGILARNAGPQAVVGGGIAFAAFSGAIDWYMRKPVAVEE